MKLHIANMTCGGCARGVTASIKGIDEHATVDVNLDSKIVTVDTSASSDKIIEALAENGFPAQVQ